MVIATAAFWAVVAVLPRRSGRRPGVRSSRFPYRTAAGILGVAAIVVPLTLTVLGRGLVEVVWSFALLFGLGFACAQASRRAVAPQLDRPDHLDVDGTAVVLLRGFYDDRAMFTSSDRRRALRGLRRWIGYALLDEQDFLTAEAYLGPALQASVGPLVGLGDPADHLPSGDHMLRYYAADAQWRDVMADLLPRAQAVVVLAGATESLTFELLLVRALHLQTRMFLVLPPRQPATVRVRLPLRRSVEPPAWSSHTQFFRVLGYDLPHDDPEPGTVIGFDRFCRGVVLASGIETAASYAAAIKAGLGATDFPGMPPANVAELLERLTTENAAVGHLLESEPEVRRKQRLAVAIINRSTVVDEVLRIVQRYQDDVERYLSRPSRTTAAPTIRREWLGDVDGGSETVDAGAIRILVAAWLTGLLQVAPADATSAVPYRRPRGRSRIARQFINGVHRPRATPGRAPRRRGKRRHR